MRFLVGICVVLGKALLKCRIHFGSRKLCNVERACKKSAFLSSLVAFRYELYGTFLTYHIDSPSKNCSKDLIFS